MSSATLVVGSLQGESSWSPLRSFYSAPAPPSWPPSEAPKVIAATTDSLTLGWPAAQANGGHSLTYEVR